MSIDTGTVGTAGIVGVAGTVGAAGTVGVAGTVGAAGIVGVAGTVGTAGIVGVAGTAGVVAEITGIAVLFSATTSDDETSSFSVSVFLHVPETGVDLQEVINGNNTNKIHTENILLFIYLLLFLKTWFLFK